MSTQSLAFRRRLGYRAGAALPLLAGAAAMTAGLALHGPVRAVVELPLALFLPGASVIAALRGARPARPATDAGLAVVVSFAVWIVISLASFALAQPLTTTAFIVGADLVVCASAAVCAVRRTPLTTLVGTDARRAPVIQLLLVAAVAGACCAAVALGSSDTRPPAPYSEVALAGQWAAVGSAVSVTPGAHVAVDVAVSNHTGAPKIYEVVPEMAGARWSARSFELAPGTSWRGTVNGVVTRGGCLHRLLVSVREDGAAAPVGSVTLWFQNGPRLPKKCRP
jgi:hypothetical protein